jgi:hypothetical protein
MPAPPPESDPAIVSAIRMNEKCAARVRGALHRYVATTGAFGQRLARVAGGAAGNPRKRCLNDCKL